jgi:hypothetical protein
MRLLRPLLCCFLLPLALHADLTVKSEMSSPESGDTPMPMVMKLGSGQMRMEMQSPMGGVCTIIKPQEKKMIIVMNETKTYMVRDMSHAPTSATSDEEAPPTVERTGKKEKISGYECEQVLFKQKDGSVTEFWFSPKAPSIREFGNTFQSLAQNGPGKMGFSWTRFLFQNADLSTYPVRMIARSASGTEVNRTTVSSFDSAALPADTFQPPVGYTEQKLPGFGGGAGGGDMEKFRAMQQEMMKQAQTGQQPTPEQVEAMKAMAEKMQQQAGQ